MCGEYHSNLVSLPKKNDVVHRRVDGVAASLDCIFILEHKKQAAAGHEEIVAAVLYPPVQIAMFAMSLVLGWSMISLMTVSESSESSV